MAKSRARRGSPLPPDWLRTLNWGAVMRRARRYHPGKRQGNYDAQAAERAGRKAKRQRAIRDQE